MSHAFLFACWRSIQPVRHRGAGMTEGLQSSPFDSQAIEQSPEVPLSYIAGVEWRSLL